MECPSCGATTINRSRRRGAVEKVMLDAVSILPFRCASCDVRFFRYRPGGRRNDRTEERLPAVYRLLVLALTIAVVLVMLVAVVVLLDAYVFPTPAKRAVVAAPHGDLGVWPSGHGLPVRRGIY